MKCPSWTNASLAIWKKPGGFEGYAWKPSLSGPVMSRTCSMKPLQFQSRP